MGDFNIHVEDHSDMEATIFNDTMQALGLKQHVNKPMHHQCNILDLFFTEVLCKGSADLLSFTVLIVWGISVT